MSGNDAAPAFGAVTGAPALILRAEGAALFVAAVAAYAWLGQSWWMFALLILAPDLAFVGYLAGQRMGAALYNALHATIGPILLGLVAGVWRNPSLAGVAAIWAAHVGFDRMLGYGLKYPDAFSHTHLGRVGRSGA